MKALLDEALGKGERLSHFGPEANLFAELEALFASYAANGTGRTRKYLHDPQEAAPFGQPPGTFTPWADLPEGTDLLFYEGLHGAVANAEVDVSKHVDMCIGVVPSSTSNGPRSSIATRRPGLHDRRS
jgi:phosphoribulokinase